SRYEHDRRLLLRFELAIAAVFPNAPPMRHSRLSSYLLVGALWSLGSGLAICQTNPVAASTAAAPTNLVSGLIRCTTPTPRDDKGYERFLLLNERAKEAGTNAQLV